MNTQCKYYILKLNPLGLVNNIKFDVVIKFYNLSCVLTLKILRSIELFCCEFHKNLYLYVISNITINFVNFLCISC